MIALVATAAAEMIMTPVLAGQPTVGVPQTGRRYWADMSEENVEIVRQFYDALNRGDWDAVFRDTHPDFELTTQRGPNAGTLRGREGVQGFGEDYIGAFGNFVVEPEEFVEKDDQVLALVTRRVRPTGGSVDIVVRNGHLWTVREGTILSMKSFPDPEKALEAVGMRKTDRR